MAAIARSRNRGRMTYVRDIPLTERLQLCKILDVPGPGQNWKQLAAILGFTADDCYSFEKAYFIPGGSPTDEMLKVWDFGNHTVTELYNKLYQMNHARGMMLLKEFVDAAHREKIKKIQGQQPEENNDDTTSSMARPLTTQPHAYRRPQEGIEPSSKLHENKQTSNLHPGMSNQMFVNQSPPSIAKPMPAVSPTVDLNHLHHPPAGFRNGETIASVSASQSSWNASASPDSQHDSTVKIAAGQRSQQFQDCLQYNLDGGTQKQIISPLVRPNYNSDERLSDENNEESKRSSPLNTVVRNQSHREERERVTTLTIKSSVLEMKYEDIKRATNNFSDSYKLGAGSFGTVYFMMFEDTKFAIKRLLQDDDPNSTMNESRISSIVKEITHLATYRHPNVVTLCFYCTDCPEPCLGYEFMQNGSLEDNLQLRGPHKQPLDWEIRSRIALGSAIGLKYLHNAQEQPLIHGDIKSANILLDENFKPKIGDFGLARYGPNKGKSYTYLTSKAYGTMPYLPKDFLACFKLSVKVDVYSFGIVLMEILTGEKAADEKREPKTKWLIHIVLEIVDSLKNEVDFERKIIDKLCDSRCRDWPWDLAWQMLELALQCTQKFPQRRPEMKEVVQCLQKINDRIEARDSLRKRSLPTENTEPLPAGREPQESHYGSSGELLSQRIQDPHVTSGTPQQNTQDMSLLDRKLHEMGFGPETTTPTTVHRASSQDQSFVTSRPAHTPVDYQQIYQPYMQQDLRSVSQDPSMPGYRPVTGAPPQSFPTGTSSTVPSSYMNRPTPPSTASPPSTNPPLYDNRYGHPQWQANNPHMQLQRQYGCTRQYTQGEANEPYTPGNPTRIYSPDEQSRYYNPNWPYAPEDTNAQYSHRDHNTPYTRGDSNMPHTRSEINGLYTRNEANRIYTHGEPPYQNSYPRPQYNIYQQQQQHQHQQPNYYPRQYSPGRQIEPWESHRPLHYDNYERMQSINPDLFSAAPPTPNPNQCMNMQGQMARLDASQLPVKYTHRGLESSGTSPVGSRNTPSPLTPSSVQEPAENQDGNSKRSTPTSEQNQQFPDSVGNHRAPVQQTYAIASPPSTVSVPAMTSKDPCISSKETNQKDGSILPVRQSPVPAEQTDIISSLKQLHLDGVTSTETTDTQELKSTSTVKSWDGERKKPVPSQHTDKLTTQELESESIESHPTHSATVGEQTQYHSAPPEIGRLAEDPSSLSMGSREPMQMTEPLCDLHQDRK